MLFEANFNWQRNQKKWIKNLIHEISSILLSCRLTGVIPSYIFQSVKLMSSKLDSFRIIFSDFFLSHPNTLHIQYLNCQFPKSKNVELVLVNFQFHNQQDWHMLYFTYYHFFFFSFLIGSQRWEKIKNGIIFVGINVCVREYSM